MTSRPLVFDMRSSDDATCTIAPAIKGQAPNHMARASARNVTEGGRAIIQECVIKRRTGGQALQIGKSTTHSGSQQIELKGQNNQKIN